MIDLLQSIVLIVLSITQIYQVSINRSKRKAQEATNITLKHINETLTVMQSQRNDPPK